MIFKPPGLRYKIVVCKSDYMSLTNQQTDAIHALWDELADFPASRVDDALQHLMQQFCRLLDIEDVVWVGAARLSSGSTARRDPLLGWRGLAVRHYRNDPLIMRASAEAARRQDTEVGMTTRALVAGAGNFRIHRLHDGFVDVAAFKQSRHYQLFYRSAGIQDRMYIGFPINSDTESFFLFDRLHRPGRFTSQDVELVAYTMRGLKWFHRELLLSHGLLIAKAALSETERRIVRLLLTELNEREIADKLGQSQQTTHKYITGILRKYGVRGRNGLTALWLNRSG